MSPLIRISVLLGESPTCMTSFDFNYLPKFLYPNAGTLSVRASTKEFHKSTILSTAPCYRGFSGGSKVKASACNAGDPGSIPGSGRPPGRRKWQSTPVFLPAESHGGRSLVGYNPLSRKESDSTERLNFHFLTLL